MKRAMCLNMPYLPIERLHDASAPDGGPIAIARSEAGTLKVALCNRSAFFEGIAPQMTVAEARALSPELRVEQEDREGDLKHLKTLAYLMQAFSPIVHIEDDTSLILDVTGCQRLFDGDDNLLLQAIDTLIEQGLTVRGAIADTPGAAWAIARTHAESTVVTEPGQDTTELSDLPVSSLRIDDRTANLLRLVGVETIGTLMYLPRASLASRFGDALNHRLQQLLGDLPEPLVPYHPPPQVVSQLRLSHATDRRDIISLAIDRVLENFCSKLTRRVAGVTRWHLTFFHTQRAPTMVTLETSSPIRSLKRMQSLLMTQFESVRLPTDVEAIMLRAPRIEPLDAAQHHLFDDDESNAEAAAELIDRLSLRLGSRAVTRATLVADHQPEHAFRRTPLVGENSVNSASTDDTVTTPAADTRPLQLWSHPAEVPVISFFPDGPPQRFSYRSTSHTVVACVGPERIETGWWRGRTVRRDYYRLVTDMGQSFWMFRNRDTHKWYLHGVFD